MKTNLRFLWLAAGGITLLPVTVFAQSSSAPMTDSPAPLAGAATPVPAETTARYTHARWTYPGPEQMADLFPPRAQDERLSGTAKIVCTIAPDGLLDKCAVLDETPKGYGFGLATATAFVKFAHVDPNTVEGGIKPGDYKVFIYKWQIG